MSNFGVRAAFGGDQIVGNFCFKLPLSILNQLIVVVLIVVLLAVAVASSRMSKKPYRAEEDESAYVPYLVEGVLLDKASQGVAGKFVYIDGTGSQTNSQGEYSMIIYGPKQGFEATVEAYDPSANKYLPLVAGIEGQRVLITSDCDNSLMAEEARSMCLSQEEIPVRLNFTLAD